MKNALKNCATFFGAATVGVVAIFVFSIVFSGVLAPVQQAHAYAIGSVGTDTAGSGNSAAGSNYDFTNSFQNLISPFTKFMSDLDFSSGTTINTHGQTSGFPVVNFTPMVETGLQNTFSQWLSQFDNWFYGISGVHLSGIFYVILNALAWTLGLAQKVVNWLLGLFH